MANTIILVTRIFIIMLCKWIASASSDIVLEYFQSPIFVNRANLYKSCSKDCESNTHNKVVSYSDSHLMSSCDGYVDECQYISKNPKEELRYCGNANKTALVYAENPIRKVKYGDSSKCVGSMETAISWYAGTSCGYCVCTCYQEKLDRGDTTGKWWFSLLEQTSEDSKVITGIRFQEKNHVIYLQIKQNSLAFDGEDSWTEIVTEASDDSESGPTNSTVFLKHDFQTIALDEIIMDENHVLTGVKFIQSRLASTNVIRLSVRQTPLNADKSDLVMDKSTWKEGSMSKSKSKTKWLPAGLSYIMQEIESTNFSQADLSIDLGKSTEPFLSADEVITKDEKDYAIKAIQLILTNSSNKLVIHPRVAKRIIGAGEQDEDYGDEDEETDSANTSDFSIFLIAILPVSIILNLFN